MHGRGPSVDTDADAWRRFLPFLDPGIIVGWMGEMSELLNANDIVKVRHFATAPCIEEWCDTEALCEKELQVLEYMRKGMSEVGSIS